MKHYFKFLFTSCNTSSSENKFWCLTTACMDCTKGVFPQLSDFVLLLLLVIWVSIQKCGFPNSLYHSKSLIAQYVVFLISDCKNIFQVSVSCGIPDFRSRDGIYARLAVDFPDLPDPQAMFDIEYFRKDPRPFFKFAKVWFFQQFLSWSIK